MSDAIETVNLGRRYRRRWALRDCSLRLPEQRVIGLVGPNGAGKSTLMHLLVGLLGPTSGQARVLGEIAGASSTRARVGFVAQDKPLYRTFTVADMLRFGAWTNPSFDHHAAAGQLDRLAIPLSQRVGQLSGGQRAQVALALALGKRPELLLLDEPVAELDPLARRQFLQVLMAEVAESGMTVLLSSHLIADLEHACDYLVLLSHSRVQLSAPTEDLLTEHRILTGPRGHAEAIAAQHAVIEASYTDRQATLLIHATGPIHDPAWTIRPATLEEVVLAYMSQPAAGLAGQLTLTRAAS